MDVRKPATKAPLLSPCLLAAAAVMFTGACSSDEEPAPPERPAATAEDLAPASIVARDKAAGYFDLGDWVRAREALAPLVAGDTAEVQDLVRAASVEFDDTGASPETALALLERARAIDPEDPTVHWGLYRYYHNQYEFELALEHLRVTANAYPDDIPTLYALATTLAELDQSEEAEQRFLQLIGIGPDFGESWYAGALYRYSTFLLERGRADEADGFRREFGELGIEGPAPKDRLRGTFGGVAPGTRRHLGVAAPAEPVKPTGPVLIAEHVGVKGLFVLRPERAALEEQDFARATLAAFTAGSGDVVLYGASGIRHATRGAAGWSDALVLEADVSALVPLDLDRADERGRILKDGRVELVAATSAGLVLLDRGTDGTWSPTELEFPVAIEHLEPGGLIAVDFDHEGDLDLIVTHDYGVEYVMDLKSKEGTRIDLLRNDGVGRPEGAFVPHEPVPAWPDGDWFASVADPDTDNDVDLVLSGSELMASERSKGFVHRPGFFPAGAQASLLADLDGDSQPDLISVSEQAVVHFRLQGGGWSKPVVVDAAPAANGPAIACDWDLDGATDLMWPTADGVAGVLAAGFDGRRTFRWELELDGPASSIAVADLDGDFDQDLAVVGTTGAFEFSQPGPGRGLMIELFGKKDNARGVGATVELRVGEAYRRIFWDGGAHLLGLGDAERADVLRVTWPNGVVQTEVDLAAGTSWLVRQREGLAGSCPFLYTWNGETYEYISDVLGITPLGLPMARGVLVPPDHDEYVFVSGEQLVARDGFFDLQFTEELREVTYLDRIRLDVVDHPIGTEIHPNERFTFPPFPENHTHTVEAPLSPLRATGSDGGDWTAALAERDEVLASPFEPLTEQFLGLATPHWIELEFDPELVRDAGKLRLLMTGWLFWTDASVNMAADGEPGIAFVPPLLQVPDGEGGWIQNGPPLGFPAGKLKTMVVDVTGRIDPADPRIRIFSTLRLYWDAIRLAVDDDDAELRVTSLEPASSDLWQRGFSEPIPLHGEFALDWFEWDRIAPMPRWNQHPGLYTRFGDCTPLLEEVDDMFAILGAGDALKVRFDARDLPPVPEGFVRDYLVFLDGWAKDRDPNSHEVERVEPLPFHGMSAYPYPEDESFPDTPEHREWRREWNTRGPKRWIAPLATNARSPERD